MIAIPIIITGALVAVNCGLLGSFLMLRRMSMVGDAISHAVLPGIVLAFLWSGSREPFPLLIGASLSGLLATFLITYFQQKARLQGDAAIGLVFTFMFALGVLLISAFADQMDIDQECVLYGEIAYIPLDQWVLADGTMIGPKAIYVLGVTTIITLVFLGVGYTQLKISTFDPGFAESVGIRTGWWHYALMGAVSLTTVTSFESVGAILVVAFMIGPPATVYLFTKRLSHMLIGTTILGIIIAILGYIMAWYTEASIAGCMAVMTGVLFGIGFSLSLYQKRRLRPLFSVPKENGSSIPPQTYR
jgi:manganese/zinc/iron transport system permease protein